MKKLYSFSIYICVTLIANLIVLPTNAQTANWLWAKSAISPSNATAEGWNTATDAAGNIFATGWFSGSNITFGSITLINNGSHNIFLVKYDPNGNVLWAISAGGAYSDAGYSVSTDPNGNVFLAGYFQSPTITFGSTTLTNNGAQNIFLTKYDPNGNVLWAKSSGGTGDDRAFSVNADTNGNVFITGYFQSPTITFGSSTLTNNGLRDVFLAKYDSSGNDLWAKSAGGTSYDMGNSVSTDISGNVLITGVFYSPTVTFGTTMLTNNGQENIFLTKYDSNGNVLWAKSAGGTTNDGSSSMSTDGNGNVFITGYFVSSTIAFGSDTLTNNGQVDIFLAKYDSIGNVLWAKSAGGPYSDYGYSVNTDGNGNVFLSGSFFNSSITLGSIILAPPAGSVDPMFIAKYSPSGNVLCADALSSGGDDNNGVAIDISGNAYIVGDFEANPFIVGADTLILTGMEDFFIAKYLCAAPLSIDGLNHAAEIFIFPNPTSDQFFIEANSTDKLSVDLYDVNGRHVYSASVSDKENINVATLDNGVYTLTIKTADRVINKKLVILR
ncbi:MAG: T9SS type A sorting domain-containing protein [Bacteroidetes bacterium]|nr:T9SS type A sorting domain-containing protein [Bacteroidota bacterium]